MNTVSVGMGASRKITENGQRSNKKYVANILRKEGTMKLNLIPYRSDSSNLRICLTAETLAEAGQLLELSKRIPKSIEVFGWMDDEPYLWIVVPLNRQSYRQKQIGNREDK